MDKYERRRQRLIELRDTRCGGMNAELARRLERSPSYITRMLYLEGRPGKRRIADDMLEVIESAFDLPRGWLDLESGTSPAADRVIRPMMPPIEKEIAELVTLVRRMCPVQRGEVLGYARRVAEGDKGPVKANAAL